jgi:hypothetical protein
MKWTLWLGLAVLVLTVMALLTRPKKSCYAPPRDENTVLPFVENVKEDPQDQTEVFKDAAGWLNMREHPLTGYFQEDAFANVSASNDLYGDFVGLESSAGDAPMTVIPASESNVSVMSETAEYLPTTTSRSVPFIGTQL